MKVQRGVVEYGSSVIDYSVKYTNRIKTMEIAVHPDSQVVVSVPRNTSTQNIENNVKKRAKWINKKQKYFLQFQPKSKPKYYLSGETHLYLGRRYKLKIRKGNLDEVKLLRGEILIISQKKSNADYNQKLLYSWYVQKAQEKFEQYFEECWDEFSKMKTEKPKLRIRRMKTRWGSLSKKSGITLNLELIRAPKDCIKYVFMHELCHLKYHDHSKNYYQLLEKVMPDWKAKKHKLELTLI